MRLQISANGRFLTTAEGQPFFYLGDTAWELFHRLSREDVDFYLETRARQGFNVIQAVVLAEYGGLVESNPYGVLPLQDNDPARPVEAYFEHVDYVVQKAESLGLVIGMLPTWGDKWNQKWGMGPEIFTPLNAEIYGEYLGRRYKDAALIWILGGDRSVDTDAHRAIITAMARGLRHGDGGTHLMTFHPQGQENSARYFHDEPWLDFNMWQTGHTRDRDNYNSIAADYALKPIKPTLDAEPGYEDHPIAFNPENGYLDDCDVRRSAYWAVFAGACGHTYGCHDIWQFVSEQHQPVTFARTPWREALEFPGANQMVHLRNLMESRPYFSRIPDQSLVLSGQNGGPGHIAATRDDGGSYALVYFAAGTPGCIGLDKLSDTSVRASWFNPRNGESIAVGEYAREPQEFAPPTSGYGQDWVLVLDAVR
jgi:hypothetical protein